MARILSEESSLTRKHKALGRESRVLTWLIKGEAVLAGLLLVGGGVWAAVAGRYALLWVGVAAAILAGAHLLKVKQNVREEGMISAGVRGEVLVSRMLADAFDDRHYLFNDLMVKVGRLSAQVDHVLVAPTGIFLIETKNWRGHLEGRVADRQWSQTRQPDTPPIKISNPVMQNDRHEQVVRALFRQAELDWPDIYPLVIFTSQRTTWRVDPPDAPVFRPRSAVEFIASRTASRAYSEADVDRVLQLFMKAT